MKLVVQGCYQEEWIRANCGEGGSSTERPYIPPVPTRAAIGHSYGAQKYLRPHDQHEEWKISKFRTTAPRVTQWMGGKLMDGTYGPTYVGGHAEPSQTGGGYAQPAQNQAAEDSAVASDPPVQEQ